MEQVLRLVPFDDRRIDQRVLGLTRNSVNQAMRRACQAAGIPHFHPHDLRHRHASVRIARGESVLVVQRDLGHAKASMTSTRTVTSSPTVAGAGSRRDEP
jgi:integrase